MFTRYTWLSVWTGFCGIIYWLFSQFFGNVFYNWATTMLEEKAKGAELSMVQTILWLYHNPIWAMSGFVGIYVIGLASITFVPVFFMRLRSSGIQVARYLMQRDKQFLNEQTRQLLAVGDVAVVEIINNGLPATIVPEVRFVDVRSKTLMLVGRWTDSALLRNQQAAVHPIIIGTGQRRLLDIGIRFAGEGELWFALDNNSPFATYRFPDYNLISPIIVHVIINGNIENRIIKREWFFSLISDGSANIVQINKRAVKRFRLMAAAFRSQIT